MLYDFKEKDRAWSFADRIIEQCKDPRSVFYGLIVGMEVEWDASLLEEMVQNKWALVPLEQRESIKSYSLSKVLSVGMGRWMGT